MWIVRLDMLSRNEDLQARLFAAREWDLVVCDEALRDGLVPFVERELKAKLGSSWLKAVNDSLREDLRQRADGSIAWDTQGLFTVMEKWWSDVFRFPLGRMERSYVNELRETRNDFAYEKTFTYEDTERARWIGRSVCCARSRPVSRWRRPSGCWSTSGVRFTTSSVASRCAPKAR